ncbi:MAG: prolyl aminopeptidase [Candidatus Melainabacteria bacterium]|nr:prolyl aminopeptidase [Candidatus Melainabacteria bacterium]
MTHTLYPAIEPYHTFQLPVSARHTLYVEAVGNPQGIPVVFLHGGPGAGCSSDHRRIFDPERFHIILFDQRGCGRSTPHACLEENTTWDLVADMERIRERLGIDRWLVFGGSWGSTLALAYGQTHPERTAGLILRGIFLCRPEEFRWFYQEGCHWIFPDAWQHYLAPIPPEEQHDLMRAYYQRLTHPSADVQLEAARAWSIWEGATCHLKPNPATIENFGSEAMALSLARIECHYFMNGCFFEEPNQLLTQAHRLADIPTWIVHGRYDVVCPVKNAWDLHQVMPHAKLIITPDAGHAYSEPSTLDALITATNQYALACVPS